MAQTSGAYGRLVGEPGWSIYGNALPVVLIWVRISRLSREPY